MKSIDDSMVDLYKGKQLKHVRELNVGSYICYGKAIWECIKLDNEATFCMYAYANSVHENFKSYINDKNKVWSYADFHTRRDMFHVNDLFLMSDLVSRNHYITNAILRGTL